MKRKYRGILATGATMAEATSNFRDLVFGNGASMLVDENGSNAFVAKASVADRLFNPSTGDMNLVPRNSLLTNIKFVSQSSVEDDSEQEAFHAKCSDGCGTHIIASNESLLKFCPLCTAALSSDNGEESGDHGGDGFGGLASDDDGAENSDDENTSEDGSDDDDQLAQLDAEESTSSSVVRRRSIRPIRRRLSASAAEESDDEPEENSEDNSGSGDSGDSAISGDSNDSGDLSESSELEPLVVCSSTIEEAVQLFRKHKRADFTSVSSGEIPDNIDLELYSCSSSEGCGCYTLAEAVVDDCPSCHAKLNEPSHAEAEEYAECAEGEEDSDEDADVGSADSDDDSADLPTDDPIDGMGDETDEGEPQETSEASDDIEDDTDEDEDDAGSDDELDLNPDDAGDDDETDDVESTSAVELPDRRISVSSEEDDDGEEISDDEDSGDGDSSSLDITSDDGTPLAADDGEDDDSEISVMPDDTDDASDLDVSYSASIGGQPMWTAYVKGRPVAMAHRADCSDENKEMFDTPRFGQAVIATAKVAGVNSALDELRFRPIKYSFSASRMIRAAVENGIESQLQSISSEQEEFAERFEAALATAAIGINRGFFKDDVSPLKEALCSTMRACGTHAPERLVDRVFQQTHDSYLKMLISRAKDIMSKPEDVQESLSRTILDVNYQPMQSESSESENLEARLGTIGSPIATASTTEKKPEHHEVSTSSGAGDWQVKSKQVVSGLGRRR